ncbi:MAG: hypothetical protein A4S17_07845 [Proteobacteria bacterium HN_bin10]|nr:MAG: hypothetical protein A4S17_07845 [Proteobacteria bacterium HN_bin10]
MSNVDDNIWEDLTGFVSETFQHRIHEVGELAHYTNFAALKNILETEEMWFSSVTQMNDYDEIVRGKELLIELSAEGSALHEVVMRIQALNEPLWRRANQAFVSNQFADLFNTYISCWSACHPADRTHDNLTMWRGYAANGNGVAMVVSPLALGMLPGVLSEIIACPVFYETESEFAGRAVRAFERYLEGLARWNSVADSHHELVADAFAELCFYLAVTHKHPGFSAEREWRFVWRKERHSQSALNSYLRPCLIAGDLVERFCFPIRPNQGVSPAELDIRRVISSIMIGPCEDQYLKRLAVVNLMASRGFDNAANKVVVSTIPFRHVR